MDLAASYLLLSLGSLTEGKAFRALQTVVPALVQRTSLGIASVPGPLFFTLAMAVFHKKPASQIVEQTLASNAERAQQAISKAQNEIARAKKLAHKSLAVVDKARSIQAKKRT